MQSNSICTRNGKKTAHEARARGAKRAAHKARKMAWWLLENIRAADDASETVQYLLHTCMNIECLRVRLAVCKLGGIVLITSFLPEKYFFHVARAQTVCVEFSAQVPSFSRFATTPTERAENKTQNQLILLCDRASILFHCDRKRCY